MVLWPGPELRDPTRLGETQTQSNWALGCLLVSCGVMALASSTLLVEHVATKFDSNMSLAAMTSLSGAIQSGIVAAITEKNGSAWLGLFQCGLGIGTILYGGIVVAGLMFYAQIWCIHKQGPVFVGAFSPLLIVFSFLLETPIFGTCVHAGSVFGSIIVVFGLYLLLWGKAVVEEEEESIYGGSKTIEENYPIIVPNYESLGLNYPLISNMSGFPILVT
ncbi:hypothetical protein Syun_024807 [Stephania yunnanensis]|uniref:WAT1-related protein n=1 Tax=Stephania yunnanensis TaxID=152371 RepID=A0AAP0ETF8_9MAGN